jgi:hypothetical protein
MSKSKQKKTKGLSEKEVNRILEVGTQEEIENLRKRLDISPERLRLFEQFAKLRRKILDETDRALEKRKQKNPLMTRDEEEMGVYFEAIEPQVSNAVRILRGKGYKIISSGFYGDNRQRISFNETKLSNDFEMPRELLDFLKEQKVEIYFEPDEIILTCNKFLNIEELTETWNKVAEAMPDVFQESTHRENAKKKEDKPFSRSRFFRKKSE